jgi:hypothetical protein
MMRVTMPLPSPEANACATIREAMFGVLLSSNYLDVEQLTCKVLGLV